MLNGFLRKLFNGMLQQYDKHKETVAQLYGSPLAKR